MSNVTGFVYYDPTRTGAAGTGLPNIPVALYSPSSGTGAIALTNSVGAYTFTNIPSGKYYIIETWGTAGGISSPVDYSKNATSMPKPPEVEPPISAVPITVPDIANALNAITPNLLKINLPESTTLTCRNFYDAAVGNEPLTFCGVNIKSQNLITAADNGTFGNFPSGTGVMTTCSTPPYPDIVPDFDYSTCPTPSCCEYTVMNTRTHTGNPWWPISDHTSKVETGRYLLINGAKPCSIAFSENINVTPCKDYLFGAWILNLIYSQSCKSKLNLAFQVLASDGMVLFYRKIDPITPTCIPVWYQNGFIFNTECNNNITVQIVSENTSCGSGNDFLIDDIFLYRVCVETLLCIRKSATPTNICNGMDVIITSTVNNVSNNIAKNVIFEDVLDPSLVFVNGSVTVNSVKVLNANPNNGFSIGDITSGDVKVVEFHATSRLGPAQIENVSKVSYNISSNGNCDKLTETIISNCVIFHRPACDLCQSSIDLVESVALEQVGLAHILNAEGEKIQAMLAHPCSTPEQLLAINASVVDTINSIISLECVMLQKLQSVKKQFICCHTLLN